MKAAVCIAVRARCECGFELMEEDFMATWVGENKDKKRFRLNVHENSQDIDAAHKVTCESCSRQFTPQLAVTCYRLDEGDALVEAWNEVVSHMSPYGMLFKYEQLLSSHGTCIVREEALYNLSPQVYWVSQFYAVRLQLPSGMIPPMAQQVEKPGPAPGPIILGSRQNILAHRAKDLLQKGKVSSENMTVPLSLVYPTLDESDLAILASIQQRLDGAKEGIRDALLELSKVESLINRSTDKPSDIARALYKNLLILCHVGQTALAPSATETVNIFLTLNGPSRFDLTLYNSLKQCIDPLDLEFMQIEEVDLVGALPSRSMMGFRQAWGLLI
jgi:hypothetical protein